MDPGARWQAYGTTSYGGVRNGISVPAAFVRFDPSAQNLTIYHRFNDFDGQNVSGGVTLGSDNYFYGTTTSSASDCGLLYRITVNGTYTVLHNFGGGSDGCGPVGPPIEATDGNFYGIAGPTIYKFTRDGVFSALFTWWSGDGLMDGLMQASDGKLWATVRGGSYPECGFNLRIALYGGLLNVGNFCTPDGYSILPLGPLLAGCGKTDWQRVFLSMIPCWRC